jgi:hypothetical protein
MAKRQDADQTLRLSLDAENERARLARKRQMYTDCVTTFAEMITATSLHRSKYSLAEKNKKLWEPVEAQYQKAFDAMVRAEVILSLGAPRPVTKLRLKSGEHSLIMRKRPVRACPTVQEAPMTLILVRRPR